MPMPDLIITNGDAAAEKLAAAGVAASVIAWRDVLHEGPLRADLSLEQLSDLRAAFLAEYFGIDFAEVRAEFGARDAIMRKHEIYDRITIWLEHDLYDQLQLLQILAFFAAEGRAEGLVLVQADDFLGNQTPETILRFNKRATQVERPALDIARRIWSELCESTPEAIVQRLHSVPDSFPFLGAALGRFLAELPSPGSGLSRTESTIVENVAGYEVTPAQLFRMAISTEEAAFMGDWSFYRVLDGLAFAPEPLLGGLPARFPADGTDSQRDRYLHAQIELTAHGINVHGGASDNLSVNAIDRWWGGTHLLGHSCWRWDRAESRLISPSGAAQPEADEAS
jgi:hypothetical protein